MIEHIIGVDLGQSQDFSALVVLRRAWWRGAIPPEPEYMRLWHQVMSIARWPLGTSYPKIAHDIGETYAIFDNISPSGVKVVVDKGGPGAPVLEMQDLKKLRPTGVTITGGLHVSEREDGSLTVPKRDICSALIVAAQGGNIKVATDNELAGEFDKEIAAFGYKVNLNSGETYESQQSSVHDDMVLAAAMALWYSTTQLPVRFPLHRSPGRVRDMDYLPLEAH